MKLHKDLYTTIMRKETSNITRINAIESLLHHEENIFRYVEQIFKTMIHSNELHNIVIVMLNSYALGAVKADMDELNKLCEYYSLEKYFNLKDDQYNEIHKAAIDFVLSTIKYDYDKFE